jgi:hypothetical protein
MRLTSHLGGTLNSEVCVGVAQVRFSHVDLGTAQYLDVATGRILPRSPSLTKRRGRATDADKEKGA